MKKIFIFVLMVISLLTAPALAAEKLISATGMYIAGASESLNDAKQNALQDAMRQAAEQAGVLVNSYSKTHNMQLTDDEVTVVATKIIKVIDKKFDVELLSDSEIKVTAYVDVVVNTESMNEDIIKLKNKNEELLSEKTNLQIKQDALNEMNKLKNNIVEKYRNMFNVFNGPIKTKKLDFNCYWKDAVSNFDIEMSRLDYYGSGGSLAMAHSNYLRSNVPQNKWKDYVDDVICELEIKAIERHIAMGDYDLALMDCCSITYKISENNFSTRMQDDSKEKLIRYVKVIGEYLSVYEPEKFNDIMLKHVFSPKDIKSLLERLL